MLDFQLREHQEYLKHFRELFTVVDLDGKGILSEARFVELMKALGVACSAGEITYYLRILDPFNTQCITFSDVVQLLSSHQPDNGKYSVLQLLNLKQDL